MSIVREFSRMLSSIPHDQAFTQLLLSQIVTYYDKCCGWYKSKDSQKLFASFFLLTFPKLLSQRSHPEEEVGCSSKQQPVLLNLDQFMISSSNYGRDRIPTSRKLLTRYLISIYMMLKYMVNTNRKLPF